MRVLVTGAAGFVGRHVRQHLREHGHAPAGLDVAWPAGAAGADDAVADLREPAALGAAVRRAHPDGCVHLGGIAFVPMGWRDPQQVFDINLIGTLNLLEALRREAPAARALVIGSAEVYGRAGGAGGLTEDAPLEPSSLYAVSKLAAEMTALLYHRRYGLPVMIARPGNHIGPGQSLQFVASSFAAQLADIRLGRREPVMRVGDLDARRDFTDVRDVVRAYRLILERGRPGACYNVASGVMRPVRDILEGLIAAAGVRPRIEVDPALCRPREERPPLNSARLRDELGWQPAIPMADSLRDIFADALATRAPS